MRLEMKREEDERRGRRREEVKETIRRSGVELYLPTTMSTVLKQARPQFIGKLFWPMPRSNRQVFRNGVTMSV